jgi:hypothetical protein
MENQQQSSSSGSSNNNYNETNVFKPEYTMEENDAKVVDQLETQWECVPFSSNDVCRDSNIKNRS